MKIAILCGGPSPERGISLNSARSVLDHLECDTIEIIPIYFDAQKKPYRISPAQLYSNTPSDFDFKLHQAAKPLNEAQLIRALKQVDMVFPIMHGAYGEDGGIQRFLEKNEIPFVGSGSQACKRAFDKFTANEYIKFHGFFTLPSALLKIHTGDHEQIIKEFFTTHRLERAIIKPASGGSSIGVFSVSTPQEALEKAHFLFSKRADTRLVLEPFAQGTEFTIIILENRFGLPVALPATEIETDYTQNQIFDFRKKYLPTRQVTWHCPPRFDNRTIEKIQVQAEQIFTLLGMRDFGRFDGWVLPSGDIWFCDLNPISGMEQNSFLFQQSARVGMTHADVLCHVVDCACQRQNVVFERPTQKHALKERQCVPVLAGGDTSERQVSLMSGTNVWLKLRKSKHYRTQLYLLDLQQNVWKVPYHLALSHTAEEIADNCNQYAYAQKRMKEFEERARLRLGFFHPSNKEDFFEPQRLSLDAFASGTDVAFIALHGGKGEDGTLQKFFADRDIRFNGSDAAVSALCMDKWETAQKVRAAQVEGVTAIPNSVISTRELLQLGKGIASFWETTSQRFAADSIIIKPRSDGCSTGVVRLYNAKDLEKYIHFLERQVPFIPKMSFKNQKDIIEMPTPIPEYFLLERFVETDNLYVKGNQIKYYRKEGWLEVTVGVLEKQGVLHALNPSITVAEGEVLSVEEKFQGGTGVNITPPPKAIIPTKILQKIKERIQRVAQKIGVRGYTRIDAFVHVRTGEVLIIEFNTLPALTPSTVLYHQALAEDTPIFPRDLLEIIVDTMLESREADRLAEVTA